MFHVNLGCSNKRIRQEKGSSGSEKFGRVESGNYCNYILILV